MISNVNCGKDRRKASEISGGKIKKKTGLQMSLKRESGN